MNLTNNFFVDNDVGVLVFSESNCKFEFYFNSNNITFLLQPIFPFSIGLFIKTEGNSEGTVNIVNCVFKNCSGTTLDFYTKGVITIKDSVFQGNKGACLVVTRNQSNSYKFADVSIYLNNVTF